MVDYWDGRYQAGRGSGRGSRGLYAKVKSDWVNGAVRRLGVETILDLGSGDGHVAALIDGDYLGVDPSPTAVKLAREAAPHHTFAVYQRPITPRECHLSLDVIRHLVADGDYRQYLDDLFSAETTVMVWSSDIDRWWSDHERERHWTRNVPAGWSRYERRHMGGTNLKFDVYRRT